MIKSIWQNWKLLTKKIGHFQMTMIFSILYYLLLTPLGLIFKRFNGIQDNSEWSPFLNQARTLEEMKDQ